MKPEKINFYITFWNAASKISVSIYRSPHLICYRVVEV